jgi:sulfite exporter TauE/SafE
VSGAGALATGGAQGAASLAPLRAVLAWVAGATLVGFGIARMLRGRRASRAGSALAGRIARSLGPLWSGVRALPGPAASLGVGLLTGLLPCGLSWAALVLAAASTPAAAALGMLVFGLATGPALVLVATGWRGLAVRGRELFARALGPLLVLLGLYTAARGGTPAALAPVAERALPECCGTGAEAQPRALLSADSPDLHGRFTVRAEPADGAVGR